MYSMIGLSVFTMLVSWFSMSASSAFYITVVLVICIFSLLYTLQLTQWITTSTNTSQLEIQQKSEYSEKKLKKRRTKENVMVLST